VLNPWANFNISGQFLCESFALLSPAMPQTAAQIGLNYTLVAIDGEPAQATQLFTSMIATAFISDGIEEIIEAGISSIDSNSKLNEIVANVRKWHKEFPDDWRSTRKLVKEKYTRFGGAMRDKNGYELNTASIIAALLYGKGDPAFTLRIAFNFGWDADCNAATVGTVVGTMKGYRWMMSQGWTIVDRYANKTRENMPDDETITSFADRLIDLAEIVIGRNGGSRKIVDGKMVYYIRVEKAGNVRKLTDFTKLQGKMLEQLAGEIELGLKEDASKEQRAKAAYLALCLGNSEEIKNKDQKNWDNCLGALREYPGMIEEIFRESSEYGVGIQQAAVKAGLK
ncbi:MAG: ADP-ribosylglycohydrolase family protein, partial [Planctomycetota bacterium]